MKAQMAAEARKAAFKKAETDLCVDILWLVLRMPALHAKSMQNAAPRRPCSEARCPRSVLVPL